MLQPYDHQRAGHRAAGLSHAHSRSEGLGNPDSTLAVQTKLRTVCGQHRLSKIESLLETRESLLDLLGL